MQRHRAQWQNITKEVLAKKIAQRYPTTARDAQLSTIHSEEED